MEISTLYNYFKECGKVTTDTRNCPEGSMFIALKGETFNGNVFAKQALEKGCRYAVVDEKEYADSENIFFVDNCLKTLQNLAREHRRQMGTRIIGITGTNGKTTTKELIATVLQKKYNVLYTQGNLNNHIGVPLTLLNLTKEHELAVVEMGANHPGEIRTLVNIAEPDCGLITNVGKAHLEGFGSFEGVVKTKSELYDYLRAKKDAFIFLDKDNEVLCQSSSGLENIGYGMENDAFYVSGKLHACAPFLAFEWKHEGKLHDVQTHLIGAYNVKNALAAIAIGCRFGVPAEAICEALNNYIPSNNRSQLTETADNHLIVDAYNANPTSMMAALENFRLMEVPHKVAVLGDMKELGEGSTEEHRQIVAFLKKCDFEKVILVGAEFGKVNEDYEHFPQVDALKQMLAQDKPKGKFILIKGSNSMKLAQLKEIL
ncbi:MAG: UDP-N-acetylmuramoyl-tripeptide--D-alanyl-D-alanine ligase [Bacteroidaceae bacterium]|nr:UDP-N-acetylmuramoyl-tripeptide--D-alanyl-D-alanine ligase [Bacteroidaceae bacterium]